MSKEIVRLYNYLERVDYLEDVLPNNPTTLELPFFSQLINSFFFKSTIYYTGRGGRPWYVTTYIRTKEKKRKEKKKEKDRGKGKEKGKTHQVKSRTNQILSWKEKDYTPGTQ